MHVKANYFPSFPTPHIKHKDNEISFWLYFQFLYFFPFLFTTSADPFFFFGVFLLFASVTSFLLFINFFPSFGFGSIMASVIVAFSCLVNK